MNVDGVVKRPYFCRLSRTVRNREDIVESPDFCLNIGAREALAEACSFCSKVSMSSD